MVSAKFAALFTRSARIWPYFSLVSFTRLFIELYTFAKELIGQNQTRL
jgi:hypothetical protein